MHRLAGRGCVAAGRSMHTCACLSCWVETGPVAPADSTPADMMYPPFSTLLIMPSSTHPLPCTAAANPASAPLPCTL